MAGLKNKQKVPVFFIAKFSDGPMGAIEVGSVWKYPTTRIKKSNPREGVAHEEEDAFAIPIDALLWVGEDPAPILGTPEDDQSKPSRCRVNVTVEKGNHAQLRLL